MVIHWTNSRGEERAGPRLAYFTLEGVKYVVVYSTDQREPILLAEGEFTVTQTRVGNHL